MELGRKYLNVFFNIFTNNQQPELQMQNRAQPSPATTVANCYKRELELISTPEIIQRTLTILDIDRDNIDRHCPCRQKILTFLLPLIFA